MNKTSISWTQYSSNPIGFRSSQKRGWLCSKISPGCMNCYAEALNKRYGNGLSYNDTSTALGEWYFREREIESWNELEEPSRIFVCDMTDLFNNRIPDSFRDRIFEGMRLAPWHYYQVLTKRPEEALSYLGRKIELGTWEFPSNLWLGVSVENADYLYRIDILRKIPVNIRFISFEPLIGDIGEVDLRDISWIIIGGESGPHHRPMDIEWARNLIKQAKFQNVAVWMKQLGGLRPEGNLEDFPEDLRVREFPNEMAEAIK